MLVKNMDILANNLENNKPLLSICIPTYNRSMYLKKTCDSIVKQDEFVKKEVELVVSDNFSSDDTEKICKMYASKYSNFVYHRNSSNIKDENFPMVLSKASGIYRKVFNDTFICLDGKLRDMCDTVLKYLDMKPQIFWTISKYIIDDKNNKYCEMKFRDFVLRVSERMTNLIYFGLWEDDCENILDDVDACKIKIWQADMTLKNAYSKGSVALYNNVIVDVQNVIDKNVTYNIFDTFYIGFLSLVKKYVDNGVITVSDYNSIRKRMLFDTFYHWSMKWKDSKLEWEFNNKENLPFEIKNAYANEWYYPLFLAKLYIAKMLRLIKRSVLSFKR